MERFAGSFLTDYVGNSLYQINKVPFEYVMPWKFLSINYLDYYIIYSCNECGFYGAGGCE
jgi:hypothetical protein